MDRLRNSLWTRNLQRKSVTPESPNPKNVLLVAQKISNTLRFEVSELFGYAKIVENNKRTDMPAHDERLQEVLDKLSKDLVEYFDSGFIVATFQEGSETKNAFIKFGNDYAIEGLVSNIHDILYAQDEDEDDDDLDDGDLKKVIKDL